MKKVISCLLIAVMVLSMCSWAAAEAVPVEVIDFEDGAFGFLGISKAKANAGAPALEVAEFNGSKALKVTPDANVWRTLRRSASISVLTWAVTASSTR